MIQAISLFIITLFSACSRNRETENLIPVINVWDALDSPQELKLSQFTDSIEYIPLEVTDSSILQGPIIEVTKEFIIARNSGPSAMGPILLFDRKTGHFLKCIGRSGRGPEEFQMGNSTIYNIYSKVLYGSGYNHDIKEYSLQGKFLGSFKLPVMVDENVPEDMGTPSINLDQYIDSNTFVASISNFIGWDKRRIIIFSKDTIIKIFPNHLFWKREQWESLISPGQPSFFRYNNQLCIKEIFNDTVFTITKASLIPKFVFNTMGHTLPIEALGYDVINSSSIIEKLSKYLSFSAISEAKNYIFFHVGYNKISYIGIYDKVNCTTTLCKLLKSKPSGIIDDINGFLPFRPKSKTTNDELYSTLEATDIINWISDNPNKAKELENKIKWIKTISLTSNPVVVLVKIKK